MTIKYIAIVTILFFSQLYVSGQKLSFNKGAFISLKDLLENKPTLDESAYNVEKVFPDKKNQEIGVYKVFSINDSYKESYFRRNIFAVTKNEELYLNAKILDISNQFCKVVTKGRYITFLVAINDNDAQIIAGALFGVIGALATAGTGEMKLYAYCLDVESGLAEILHPKRMNELLTPFPELKESYDNEVNNGWKTVMIDYINMLNKKFE